MLLVQLTLLVDVRLTLGWLRSSNPPTLRNKSSFPGPLSSVMDLDDVEEEEAEEEDEDEEDVDVE